jgi:hypothetical protein
MFCILNTQPGRQNVFQSSVANYLHFIATKMTPLTILFAVLPVLALATPAAPARNRGANSAAGPIACITNKDAPLFFQPVSDENFRGSYASGVGVSLLCYTIGTSYENN